MNRIMTKISISLVLILGFSTVFGVGNSPAAGVFTWMLKGAATGLGLNGAQAASNYENRIEGKVVETLRQADKTEKAVLATSVGLLGTAALLFGVRALDKKGSANGQPAAQRAALSSSLSDLFFGALKLLGFSQETIESKMDKGEAALQERWGLKKSDQDRYDEQAKNLIQGGAAAAAWAKQGANAALSVFNKGKETIAAEKHEIIKANPLTAEQQIELNDLIFDVKNGFERVNSLSAALFNKQPSIEIATHVAEIKGQIDQLLDDRDPKGISQIVTDLAAKKDRAGLDLHYRMTLSKLHALAVTNREILVRMTQLLPRVPSSINAAKKFNASSELREDFKMCQQLIKTMRADHIALHKLLASYNANALASVIGLDQRGMLVNQLDTALNTLENQLNLPVAISWLTNCGVSLDPAMALSGVARMAGKFVSQQTR